MSRLHVREGRILLVILALVTLVGFGVAQDALAADELPPQTTCTDPVSGWFNATQTLHFTSADRGGSAVRYWYAILDGGLPPWVSTYNPAINPAYNSWAFGAPADHANDGLHKLEFWAVDAAGNAERHARTQVGIDTRAPGVTVTGASPTPDPPGWTRAPLVTVEAADPRAPDCAGILEVGIREAGGQGYDADVWATTEDGPYVTRFSHVFALPATGAVDGKRTWSCWARDASKPFAGAGVDAVTVYLNIDTRPPVTESDADAAWHSAPVTVSFSASDPDSPNDTGSSGVSGTECALDGAALAAGASLTVPAPADHSGDGVHQLVFVSADAAGNAETPQSGAVRIDTTAPQTTDDADAAWHTAAVTVHFTANDPLPTVTAPVVSDCSTVAVTRYSLDGVSWQTGDAVTIPVPAGGMGSQTVQYYSEDKAGNREGVQSCVVKIDTAPPTTSVGGLPSGWVNHDVTLEFSATPGPSGSAVAYTEYSTDGVTWTKGKSLTIVAPADHSADGVHSVSYRSADAAEHVEPVRSCDVLIDTTPAAPRALAAVAVKKGGKATFKYRVDDMAGSTPLSPTATVKILIKRQRNGVQKTVKTLRLGECETNTALSYAWSCTLPAGSYTYCVAAADAAGNPQAVSAAKKLTVR